MTADGKLLATGAAMPDKTVRLWEVPSGKPLAVLQGHDKHVHNVEFSADGRLLASIDCEHRLRVWDVPKREALGVLGRQLGGNWALAVSPDGRAVATADGFGGATVWDVAARREKARLALAGAQALVFSPAGDLLASAGGGAIRLWDAATGKARGTHPGHAGAIRRLAFTTEGRSLLSAGAGEGPDEVKVWDVASRKERATLYVHPAKGLGGLAVPRDGGVFLTGGTDGTVKVWRLPPP